MASPEEYIRTGGDGRATRQRQLAARAEFAVSETQEATPLRQASPETPNAVAPKETMFTRSYDGFNVGYAWLKQLAVNDDSILRREGQHDLALFDALLDDDVVFSAFQQRQLALVSRPWEVEPGDDKDARSVQAADHLRGQLGAVGWDRICALMMFSRWYGFGVGEAIYTVGGDGLLALQDIIVPDRRWFAFTNEGELRMRTPDNANGLPVPPNKFWTIRTGGTHDFSPYGTGLAHWCYWPVWFKKNVLKFWALFLEKFGMPTTVGLIPPGTAEDDPLVDKVLEAASAVGRDSAVVVDGILGTDGKLASPITTVEANRSGSGASSYKEFVDTMDEAISRVILGQTMTSRAAAGGIGSNQSDTQKDVRDEIVRADSDVLHESFNRTIARWLTAWNFGPDVAPPRVYRNMDDAEDLNQVAERDAKLYAIGIRRTEDSVKETYGEGYEVVDLDAQKAAQAEAAAKAAADAAAARGQPAPGAGGNVVDLAAEKAKRAAFAASDPRPLYVYRQVSPDTAKAIAAWAKDAGFPSIMDPAEMHTTVLYSKTPVDWFKMDDRWGTADDKVTVPEGGARKVEQFGDAVVLLFASPSIKYRHDSMVEQGASHDYDEYAPHITFTYDRGDVDLAKVEPYTGPLEFGPEMFEPINENWADTVDQVAFSAEDDAAIDALATALAEKAGPIFEAMGSDLRNAIAGIKGPVTAESLKVALLEFMEQMPVDKLAMLGAVPTLAARAAAAAGVEERLAV